MRLRDSRVIIIGPPDVAGVLAREVECDAVEFRTLEDLDRWREQQRNADDTIRPDLIAALEELGVELSSVPKKLRSLLESIAVEKHVPTLGDLEHRWSSRRSFYRMWNEVFDQPPSTFLRHVRSLHALRLLSLGFSKKEAALAAGYSSVDQMRRNMRRH
jgi:AraC-like DNA-binding protein